MIFLSGGGSSDDSFELDDVFLKSSGERLLYIPVGLKRTFIGYEECVEWFNSMLAKHHSKKNVSVWLNLHDKADILTPGNFDAVYIGGASDTFRLHEILKENGIYRALDRYVTEGGVLYGGSGGATVLGKTINYDQAEKSLPIILDTSGDLLSGISIFTHLTRDNKDALIGAPYGNVIGISEKTGLVFDPVKKTIAHTGKHKPVLFSAEETRELEPGEVITDV